MCRRSCCPAVTTSGVLLCQADTSAPIAFPRPGPVCRLTRAARSVPWAYPSAIPKALASCSASTYRKSSGKSRKNGNSVEPGLPKTVVIPSSRKRSKVTSRTVPIMSTPPKRALPLRVGNIPERATLDRMADHPIHRSRDPLLPLLIFLLLFLQLFLLLLLQPLLLLFLSGDLRGVLDGTLLPLWAGADD